MIILFQLFFSLRYGQYVPTSSITHIVSLCQVMAFILQCTTIFGMLEYRQYTYDYKDTETMKDMPVLMTLPADKFDEFVNILEHEHPCERTRALMEFETVFGKPMHF